MSNSSIPVLPPQTGHALSHRPSYRPESKQPHCARRFARSGEDCRPEHARDGGARGRCPEQCDEHIRCQPARTQSTNGRKASQPSDSQTGPNIRATIPMLSHRYSPDPELSTPDPYEGISHHRDAAGNPYRLDDRFPGLRLYDGPVPRHLVDLPADATPGMHGTAGGGTLPTRRTRLDEDLAPALGGARGDPRPSAQPSVEQRNESPGCAATCGRVPVRRSPRSRRVRRSPTEAQGGRPRRRRATRRTAAASRT